MGKRLKKQADKTRKAKNFEKAIQGSETMQRITLHASALS